MTIFRTFRARKAREARERAAERLQAAEARGDTRAIHAARQAMQEATTRLLRVEVRK